MAASKLATDFVEALVVMPLPPDEASPTCLATSIQIDSEKRWGPLAFIAAVFGAFVVPSISGVLMPAALIAVAIGLAKAMVRGE